MAGRKVWTEQDTEFIRQNWKTSTDREISVLLNKIYGSHISARTITRLRGEMGLVKTGHGMFMEFNELPEKRKQEHYGTRATAMKVFWIVVGVLIAVDSVINYLLNRTGSRAGGHSA